jgi:hypothetical protein
MLKKILFLLLFLTLYFLPTKTYASTPQGPASILIVPENAIYPVGQSFPINVYFNTAGIPISAVALRLSYPYSETPPSVIASNIQINTLLLGTGDWACPVRTITPEDGVIEIDIACANTSPLGFSTASNTLLATFNLIANQIPIINPLILTFNSDLTVISRKSDAADILSTPESQGIYNINSPGPTVTPISTSPPIPTTTRAPVPTSSPTSFPTPTTTVCPTLAIGDLNCDGRINEIDLTIFLRNQPASPTLTTLLAHWKTN